MITIETSFATHRVTDVTDYLVIAVTRARSRGNYTNNPRHTRHHGLRWSEFITSSR
jgi:hypothetical protein